MSAPRHRWEEGDFITGIQWVVIAHHVLIDGA
jgi:hypothetical protein